CFIPYVLLHTFQPTTCHSILTGVNKGNPPWFGFIINEGCLVEVEIECNIRLVEKIVSKELLYDEALVSQANNKFIYTPMSINFHNVPQDWHTSNFNHWLGPDSRLLTDP